MILLFRHWFPPIAPQREAEPVQQSERDDRERRAGRDAKTAAEHMFERDEGGGA
jgi:hypothetical protein